jgi:multidrug efflux system membrane fusion protein
MIMKSPPRIFLFVIPLLLFSAGCSKKTGPAGPPPAPVLVGKVEQKTVPVIIKTIGTVEAYAIVAIKSQVNGQVKEIHFSKGQDVKKGDLLFTINSRSFAATLKAAEAQALKTKDNLERNRKLLEEQTISQQEYDDAVAANDEAEAARDRARLDVEYCSITAPIDGRTGDVMVDPGNLVKANDDPVLVTINQITPIYVSFALAEQYLPEVRKHMAEGPLKVKATVPADPNPEEGVASFVDNTVDKTTGTIRMKATFENKDRPLWPGQFVDVLLTVSEEPNATVVPTLAIQAGQSGQYVFVVKADQTAEMRQVVAGRSVDNMTVIEKGVQAGETVVTDGQLRVVPGGKVEIKKALQAS